MPMYLRVMLLLPWGIVAGTLLADVCAPAVVTWYHMPGGGQALCNCVDITRSTATDVVEAQLIGGAIGGFVFLMTGLLWSRRPKNVAPHPPA